MPEVMVLAEAVHKSYGSIEVLKGHRPPGRCSEVMCLLGPAGSGKSTFLRCINHSRRSMPAGSVDSKLVGYREQGEKLYELKDREVCRKRQDIGMVFQQFNLFPHMTVLEDLIEAPVGVKGEPRSAAIDHARS